MTKKIALIIANKICKRSDQLVQPFITSQDFRKRGLLLLLFMGILSVGILIAVYSLSIKHGLIGHYYNGIRWKDSLRMTVRDGWLGLHRIPSHWVKYSIEWTGVIYLPISGGYEFMLASDDGSELYINNKLLVDNGGYHAFRGSTKLVYLKEGFYPITIRYFQNIGEAALTINWRISGDPRTRPLPQAFLFPEEPDKTAFYVERILRSVLPVLMLIWFVCFILGISILLMSRRVIQPVLSRNSYGGKILLKFYGWYDYSQVLGVMAVKNMAVILIYLIFIFTVSLITFSFYQETEESFFANLHNILSGKSQAPNQYRVLAPLVYSALNNALNNPEQAVILVEIISIVFCYIATGVLFYKVSRSLPLTMIVQIALLGGFVFGMRWRYSQEFFEVGLISLMLLFTYKQKVNWGALTLITVLGTLNRETLIFSLIGIAAYSIFSNDFNKSSTKKRNLQLVLVLFFIYFLISGALRFFYGFSLYHSQFWTYSINIAYITRFFWRGNTLYIGGGVLFVYLASLMKGNRAYIHFILGYLFPFLFVSFFISMWEEHRVFYPIYPLIFASVLKSFTSNHNYLA